MKKKHSIRQYNFERMYWSKCSRSDNIVSKKRIEFVTTNTWCQIISFRKSVSYNQIIQFRENVLYKYDLKSHNIVSKKRIMQSLHLDFAKQEFDQEKSIMLKIFDLFTYYYRFDILTEFNQIKKIQFRIFCIDVCSSRIWCNSFLSISQSSLTFHISLTNFMNFLQSNRINIESLMSQEIIENFETQWCYQDHDVIRILVHIAILKHKIFVSWCIFYLILNIKFHIDVSFHKDTFKTFRYFEDFKYSIAYFINRLYVIFQINTFIEFRFVRFCNLRIDAWFNLKIYHVEKVCTKVSKYASLKELLISEFTSLKELENSSFWKSLHESFKLNSSKYWAKHTNDCYEKVLKVQFSQMCSTNVAIKIQLYESIN